MLTGKQFQLVHPTLALDGTSRSGWISIPAGVIVEVLGGPSGKGNRLVSLRWEGRPVSMFAEDLAECVEIKSKTATA